MDNLKMNGFVPVEYDKGKAPRVRKAVLPHEIKKAKQYATNATYFKQQLASIPVQDKYPQNNYPNAVCNKPIKALFNQRINKPNNKITNIIENTIAGAQVVLKSFHGIK